MNIIEEFKLDPDNFVWQDLAMCVNLPIDIFFEAAESNSHVFDASSSICGYCPVREQCLAAAQGNKDQGVWAGKKLMRGKIVE